MRPTTCSSGSRRSPRRPYAPEHQEVCNFAPPATEDGVRASFLQVVRKLSGFTDRFPPPLWRARCRSIVTG